MARDYPRVETFGPELSGGTGGVSVDAEGNVYVADFGAILSDAASMGRVVFRITPEGEASIFATGFEGASGNEFDLFGNLLQSNIRGDFISRIHPDGSSDVFVSKGVDQPVGIVVEPGGTAFVANCGDGSILEISPEGESEVFVQSPLLRCPNGITLDPDHNLYVANFDNGDVVKVTPARDVSVLATVPGGNNGHLTYHEGALLVVARSANQIYRVSLEGELTLLAGTGERGRGDGPALEATFSLPNDIAPGPDGRILYVNEIAAVEGDEKLLSPMIIRRIILRPD